MITKENSIDRDSEIYPVATYGGDGDNGHCKVCGSELLPIAYRRQRRTAYVCDFIFCWQFRQPQYYVELPPDPPPVKRKRVNVRTERRCAYLAQLKENYRLLRRLKVPSKEASNMTSNKRTKEYLESIGYEYS